MTDGLPETGAGKEGAGAAPKAKSIILFSDGTGNSSGKLFKTNVWRMYEAVDLGPPRADDRKQIAFYDDGVGTSGFKPLAVLGGMFGVGLKRNVLDIYRYACRNYLPAPAQQPGQERVDGGDHIYGFGFSRGAFTMRIAVAMIAKVGLAVTSDEVELDRRAMEAWRIFRARYRPRSPIAPANIWRRWVRGGARADAADAAALHRERSRNLHPVIRFVGVWDTVAAYGGPVSEIIQAIDNWIVRLSMPNYELSDSVRCARHALALDDERDAFHPLLWDEVYEDRAIEAAKRKEKPRWIDEKRLEQVWFTGMHADVGGGYPDESLSYVSFLWMREEAQEAGLRFSPVMIERFQALANSAGPVHDSRGGVGSYYRYQPRRIAVWMEPLDAALVTRRHPDRKRGLIRTAKVHESVAARIASGTDRYAPISLPAAVKVVPPQRMGENAPQEDDEDACPRGKPKGPPAPLISDDLRDRFEHPGHGAARVAEMEAVWAQVSRRRRLYFVSLLLTLALATMPIWDDWLAAPVLASGHGALGRIIALLGAFLPGFLVGVVDSWANHPFFFLFLGTALYLSNRLASGIERSLRDDARRAWNEALGVAGPAYRPVAAEVPRGEAEADVAEDPVPTLWQRVRRFFRWRVVPALILALMAAILFWLLLAVATRISLAFLERGEALCARAAAGDPAGTRATFRFDTRRPCHATGLSVRKGWRYVVQMNVEQGWQDGSAPTDPRGLAANDIGFWGYAGVPLRRAVGARYLQPVAHIRGGLWGGPAIQPIELQQRGTPATLWRGEFVADRTGELSLFANESMLPFPIGRRVPVTVLYTHPRHGNQGTATVTIVRADAVGSRSRPADPAAGE